ncbi:MAG: M4 family metallopeptidase [Chloroflexi bacterium]|nr:M4 family metallopeptidase [Chloroflexota bacterium]
MQTTLRRSINLIISCVAILTMVFPNLQVTPVSAQTKSPNGIQREYNAETGKVTMISGKDHQPLSVLGPDANSMSSEEQSLALVDYFATEFGLANPASELQLSKINETDNGHVVSKYQQVYQGVPVMGGELIVNAGELGELYSMNGEVSPRLSLDTKPVLSIESAMDEAKRGMVKWYGGETGDYTSTQPSLWIFDERLLKPSMRPVNLVWRMEVTSTDESAPIRELVLVDAKTGNISLHFNQVDTAWGTASADQGTPTPIPPTPLPPEPVTPTPPVDKDVSDEPVSGDVVTPTNYYVNIATGSDSNSCTSIASPCKHIQETINKAASGDIVNVASGIYLFSTNASPNVVIINKDITLSGGWNTNFSQQSSSSTIDGASAKNGILALSGIVVVENFIIQNATSSNSGGIYIVNGNFTLRKSTLRNNVATNNGGGIFIDSGTLNIINSTISGNTAGSSGGGIYAASNVSASVNITNSTIAYNTAGTGGGLKQTNASVNIINTILANNSSISLSPDCNGTIASAQFDIIENMEGCTISSENGNVHVDPQIDSILKSEMFVHLPLTGSPLVDGGDPAPANCPTQDQLGNLRPKGVACDIGATETGNNVIISSGSNQTAQINMVFMQPLVVIALDNNSSPISGLEVTFTAPSSGASGMFSATGSSTMIATTDASGIATTSTFTANSIGGLNVVTASAAGYSSAQFQLTNDATPRTPSIVKYDDLIVDEARNKLYGADRLGNKIDVINMTDLSVSTSYTLVNGALPISLDLSPDGNELAIAQSGIGFVKFVNLIDNTISEIPAVLSGSSTKVTDVIYGRPGVLYALSSNGLHVINLTVSPHAEVATQFVNTGSYEQRFGSISSDKNTLYSVTGTCCSGYNALYKYDVSDGLTKPLLLKQTHLRGTGYSKGIRLSLLNDTSILITSGAVYNTSNLTPKGKNFQLLNPAIALPGKDFYVSLYDNTAVTADNLYFYDNESSYKLSSLSTGVTGTPGAITATSDGNTLFVSSTGGLAKFTIDATPPGTPIALPVSQHQYNDLVIDMLRGLVYGTDKSGRIDVINLDTTNVVNSYLLPSGANPIGIDLSPDGSELAIALNGLEKILFINPETGVYIAEVRPNLDESSIYYDNLPFDVIYGRADRLYSDGTGGGFDYLHVIDTSTHTWIAKSSNMLRTGSELALRSDKNYAYANQTFSPNNIYTFNVQTDSIAQLYQGPHGPVSANRFTIIPDGSKIFTSSGQVWDSIMQSQLGTLAGAPGTLIKYIPNQNIIALSAAGVGGDVIKFISPVDYHLIYTFNPSPAGVINEMEISPDGSKLAININNQIKILNVDASQPSLISVQSGSNQSASLGSQFPQPLIVKVENLYGQPIAGISVTFTAPSSGASGSFADTTTNASASITDINGIATSSIFSANGVKGTYLVNATVSNLPSSAGFQLVNGETVKTYTSGNTQTLPGSFLCDQTDPTCTYGDAHAKAAHEYAIGTYNFYLDKHDRNSVDQNIMPIISTVHYNLGYANAFWNGSQMVYGDAYGFPLADDVVAHELTHGVTDYESNLFYYYQSGAINESFSDVWGEYYDQSNGLGNDSLAVKWLIGEDVSGMGAGRSMSNPPTYGDPDKMTSPNYFKSYQDNGGVHTNSGVNNKVVYLMVAGGAFNSKTVTGFGWDKTAAIYYEANTNLLTSGSDYSDLYYALQQACVNLIGQVGITAGDCVQVKNALDAVQMNSQPAVGFNPDAATCAAGFDFMPIFQDDFESGLGNWNLSGRWSAEPGYASSGITMLYGDDYYPSADSSATLANGIALPSSPNLFLRFDHAFAFEFDLQGHYFDGGVLEYSIDNGSNWVDAAPLFVDGQNYKGKILNYLDTTNNLKGRSAFVGDSHGYVSSRYNLTSLGGQTVKFRWRFATDNSYYYLGWMVDDVQIYKCGSLVNPTVSSITRTGAELTKASSVNYTVTFSKLVTGVDKTDFAVATTGGITKALVSKVVGSGSTYTVTVATGSGSGTLHLNLIDNDSIKDVGLGTLGGDGAGNGNFSGDNLNIDKTAPTVLSITRESTSPTDLASVNFIVTFSEPVNGVDIKDFKLIGTGSLAKSKPVVTAVSGSGTTYTVTATTGTSTAPGTMRLDLMANKTIKDMALNPLTVSFKTGEVYIVDRAPVVVSINRSSSNPTKLAAVKFTVKFSEAVTGVDASDFEVIVAGLTLPGAPIVSITGSGTTWVVIVNTGTGSGTLGLNLVDNDTIVDSSGYKLGGDAPDNGNYTGQVYNVR